MTEHTPGHPSEPLRAALFEAIGRYGAQCASNGTMGPPAYLLAAIDAALATSVPAEPRRTGYAPRRDHYNVPVLFNPYTGEPRDVRDVQSDPQGILIVPPGAQLIAAPQGTSGHPLGDALSECATNDSPWLVCKTCAARGECAIGFANALTVALVKTGGDLHKAVESVFAARAVIAAMRPAAPGEKP